MRKQIVLAFGLVALALPSVAPAQAWQSINQRQGNQLRRIDQGVRSGALTRPEAARLRGEFASLTRLEAQYRRSNGLSARERTDLNRRFDALSRRIQVQKNDRQHRR